MRMDERVSEWVRDSQQNMNNEISIWKKKIEIMMEGDSYFSYLVGFEHEGMLYQFNFYENIYEVKFFRTLF